jgi:hypothetical protein
MPAAHDARERPAGAPGTGRRLATVGLALLGSLGATVAIAQATRSAPGGETRAPGGGPARADRARTDRARAAVVHHRAARALRAPAGAVGPRGLVGLAGITGEVGPVGPAGPPGPPGIIAQTISINWQNGAFRGQDSASFVAPGIGWGEVICSLDTQWINFTPENQSSDSEMWGAIMRGEEVSVRAAARRASSWGSEFNLGLNRAKDAVAEEPESQGSMVGIISSRGPFGAPGEPGPPPTTFHLSWYWRFAETEGGPRCYVAGTFATGR